MRCRGVCVGCSRRGVPAGLAMNRLGGGPAPGVEGGVVVVAQRAAPHRYLPAAAATMSRGEGGTEGDGEVETAEERVRG